MWINFQERLLSWSGNFISEFMQVHATGARVTLLLSIGENNFKSIQLRTFHCLRFKELSDKMRLKSTAFYQCGRYFLKVQF